MGRSGLIIAKNMADFLSGANSLPHISHEVVDVDFSEWDDLYKLREESFSKLKPDLHTVIFMDGRGVTGNHKRYNLFERDPIYLIMANTAWEIAERRNLDCTIYAASDECSIIFPNTKQLCDSFQMGDCGDYVLSLYVQIFLKLFWTKYPDILFKSTIFQHTEQEARRYLEYRKAICQHNALWWQAKEHLKKSDYVAVGEDTQRMVNLLKEHGLYEPLIANSDFYDGIKLIHQSNPGLDIYQTFSLAKGI